MSALSPEADMLIVGINVCKCHKQTLGPSDATSPLLRLGILFGGSILRVLHLPKL